MRVMIAEGKRGKEGRKTLEEERRGEQSEGEEERVNVGFKGGRREKKTKRGRVVIDERIQEER